MKDTKLEKTNHETTPRHQGNLQRFLRGLHREHEKEDREKQRAKNEVDRLNGVVSGTRPDAGGPPWQRSSAIPGPGLVNRQATPADRKKQLQQLAEMGVSVPEDYRREMAMAGDWQTTSQRLIYDDVKKEEANEDSKGSVLNVGVRKRKFEGQEEEEEAGETVVRRGWGSTTRAYPGADAADDDLDSLLKTTKPSLQRRDDPLPTNSYEQAVLAEQHQADSKVEDADISAHEARTVKHEESLDTSTILQDVTHQSSTGDAPIKHEDEAPDPVILFKKRKARPMRQK